MKRVPRNGAIGWAALAAGVLAWDLMAEETLTGAFRRARQHPAGLAAVAVTWGILTAHLFGALPRRMDPFVVIAIRKRVTLLEEDSAVLAG